MGSLNVTISIIPAQEATRPNILSNSRGGRLHLLCSDCTLNYCIIIEVSGVSSGGGGACPCAIRSKRICI